MPTVTWGRGGGHSEGAGYHNLLYLLKKGDVQIAIHINMHVCLRLKQYLGDDQKLLTLGVKYEHLFGTPEEQMNAVRMFQVLLKGIVA